jgi:prepilin-type N-terminal cleavage/methylation domain-containing protein
MRDAFDGGFSLLELLLVLSLMALMMLVAAPGFSGFITKARGAGAVMLLYSDVRFAQHSAITHDQVITLCGSDDGYHCDGAWSVGRLVINPQTNQRFRYDRLDSKADRWYWRSSFGRNDYLKFAPTGFTLGQQGRFYYCPSGPESTAKAVVVAQSGRLRLEDTENTLCASFY